MEPVIYYSNHCRNSTLLFDKIRANGFDIDRFHFFNVSTQRGRPAWVTGVPTLVAGSRKYVGDELFALFDPAPVVEEPPAQPKEMDEHDPRARLNGFANMASSKQESTIPMRSSVSDATGAYREMDAYNNDTLGLMCATDELGKLATSAVAELDLNAPVELMQLVDCEPMPPKQA